jgi:molybdopterin-guanine dinucleotide biosynthesis protein A
VTLPNALGNHNAPKLNTRTNIMETGLRVGGLILCGGKSTRMGQSKAWLPFGHELLLPRVLRILRTVALPATAIPPASIPSAVAGVLSPSPTSLSPLIVVAAVDQELPPLPADVEVLRDEFDALGPLAGLATGLAALVGRCDAVYATATDVPLLRPEFVQAILAPLLADPEIEIAIPKDGRFHHPLAACYRVRLAPIVRELVTAGRLRPVFLLELARTLEIPVDDLRSVDPQLDSLRNCNTPDDYAAALAEAGLSPAPPSSISP